MPRYSLYIGALALLLGLYLLAELNRPRALDWSPTFQREDRIPLGTAALYELLPGVLGSEVETVREPIYNWLASHAEPQAAYVLVAPQIQVDSLDTEKLLTFAEGGGTVLLAAEHLDERLSRRLGLQIEALPSARPLFDPITETDSLGVRWLGVDGHPTGPTTWLPAVLADSWVTPLRRGQVIGNTFISNDSVSLPIAPAWNRTRLGSQSGARALAIHADGRTALARIPRGAGQILVCALPATFANYLVVKPRSAAFAFRTLGLLPAGKPVYWDEYQKQGRAQDTSLFRVVRRYPALRAALWLTVVGAGLLLWTYARRRQRVVPIIVPPPNTTLAFVGTVASLYRQGQNHAPIAHRKIELFLEHVRARYQESTDNLADEPFRQRLTLKTGRTRAEINELLRLVSDLRTRDHVTDWELLDLSRQLTRVRQ